MEKKEKISNGGSSSNKEGIETSNQNTPVWLLKCPPIVSRSWMSQSNNTIVSEDLTASAPPPNSSHYLTKLTLSIDPLASDDDPLSRQFTMETAKSDSENAPKCYSSDMHKEFIPMCVFSQMKEDRGEHMMPKPAMFSHMPSNPKVKLVPKKVPDGRRSRRERVEMEGIMFKLFERQPNWTLRQLIQETDQPEQFLKDILKELCIYNNRGTNQEPRDEVDMIDS